MKTITRITLMMALLCIKDPAHALTPTSSPLIIRADEVKYPAVEKGPGVQIATLHGDTTKAEPFTLRIKWPRCYVAPPHWHPYDQEITVLSGTFMIGFGEKIDKAQTKTLTAGDYIFIPANTRYYDWTLSETILQVSAMGPQKVTLVNPEEFKALLAAGNDKCP
jgi:hypothetical protein